jgi:hypothetical protein
MKKAVALFIAAFALIGSAMAIDSGSTSTDRSWVSHPLVDRSIERDVAKLIPQYFAVHTKNGILGFQELVGGIDCNATLIEVANDCSAAGGLLTSFKCDRFADYEFTCWILN